MAEAESSRTLAELIGEWVSRESEDGRRGIVAEDKLRGAFPDASDRDLEEALAELEADGMLTLTHHIGAGLPRIRTTDELFLTFDPEVHGTDPCADASQLIELILTKEDTIGVAELHQESGLPLRRFNPALGMVLPEIGDGRISGEYNSDYPARAFFTVAEDRVALKRLLARLRQ